MPKLVLVPIAAVKNIFPSEHYLPLAIISDGYHVILNDRNEAEIVESYLFVPVESENGLRVELEENSTGIFYPPIWSKPNRMLELGKYWNVGMNSLHEQIKTAKGIRQLGFTLSPKDAILVDVKAYRIQLLKVSIEQTNAFLDVISDGYNPTAMGCIVRNDVALDQLEDLVNYLLYDHGLVNGIRFKLICENDSDAIKGKLKGYLDECLSHAAAYSKCSKINFDKIKNRILYDFLSVMEDWEYRAYFLRYDTNQEHRNIIIWDEQQYLFIFCLEYWFH